MDPAGTATPPSRENLGGCEMCEAQNQEGTCAIRKRPQARPRHSSPSGTKRHPTPSSCNSALLRLAAANPCISVGRCKVKEVRCQGLGTLLSATASTIRQQSKRAAGRYRAYHLLQRAVRSKLLGICALLPVCLMQLWF